MGNRHAGDADIHHGILEDLELGLLADDLDLEMEDANRDYVTINPDDSEKSEEAAAEEPVEEAKAEDADAE